MELVLNTFGTYLTKDTNTFVVVHKDGKQRIDPTKLKSVQISKGAQISSDAAMLAIEHNIDVFFVDGTGKPVGRIWSNKFGSITTIRRKQLDFTLSSKAVDWIKDVIIEKIDNQIALLLSLQVNDSIIENKFKTFINRLEDYKNKIKVQKAEVVSDIASSLRGWEGSASRNYFQAINLILPEEYRFEKRSQHPATDTFNALLNYGYGVLYGKIESSLIKAGIDPYVGIFHREDYNRPVLVFDIIEKYRIWIDYVVVSLVSQKAINEDCYSIRKDGSFWLEGLGKRILIQAINDYFDEIILLNSLERTRLTHINIYAQNLAQMFLNLKEE